MEVYGEENQLYMLLHLQTDQCHTRVVTKAVSLNSFNLFLVILVTRMKQLDYCKIEEQKKLKKIEVSSKNDRAGDQKCSMKKAFSKIL